MLDSHAPPRKLAVRVGQRMRGRKADALRPLPHPRFTSAARSPQSLVVLLKGLAGRQAKFRLVASGPARICKLLALSVRIHPQMGQLEVGSVPRA